MRNFKHYITTILILLITMSTNAQNLNYKIFRADENSFHIASVLITGEKDAILIDAQFSKANAYRVIANIIESGKNLTAIYISHGDPDYYFGLEIIKTAFPKAIVYATAPTIAHIKKTYQQKLDFWSPKLGNNGVSNIILPQVIKGNSLQLENHTLEIKGLDSDVPERSYVWIPSLKAIIGGVNIYHNLHLWIADAGTEEDRIAWNKVLNEMEKLQPSIVIPAHALNDTDIHSTAAISYTKEYLKTFEIAAKKAKDSETLISAMQQKYPSAGLHIALQLGAKVVKGEITW